MIHQLKVIARYSFLQEAENARTVLAGEGISSVLTNEGVLRSDWVNPHSSGGIRLEVREGDAERAREILTVVADGFDLGEIATIDVERPPAAPPSACTRCGSDDFRRMPRFRILLLILVVLTGFVAIGGRNLWPVMALSGLAAVVIFGFLGRMRCRACGLMWS